MTTAATPTRLVLATVAGIAAAVIAAPFVGDAPPARHVGEPCYNGVWPLNPNVANCNLPPRKNRVLGAAPDASAIINCRGNQTCLSLYVNGGYGWYPGAVLVPGYHP